MGIILSALAGAGDSGAQSIDQNLKQQRTLDLDAARSDLEQKKALVILAASKQAQIDTANQLREAQAARINSGMQNVVAQGADKEFGQYEAAAAGLPTGGATPLTPAQQKVIDDTKAAVMPAEQVAKADYAKTLANDPNTYIQAAMRSGDITPEKVAEIAMQERTNQRLIDSQAATMRHADDLESKREAHAERLQRENHGYLSGEKTKDREVDERRIKAMYGDSAAVSDAEKKNWVQLYIASGGVPRSAPAVVRNNVGTWTAEMGITPQDMASGKAQAKYDQSAATTAGHRAGSMAGVEAAMPALADNAMELSKKLDQGKFVPLNKLMQMANDSISDPDLASFKVAHMALVSEYQQVIARGGTNVTALKEAMHVLESAKSPQAYAAQVNQVKNEVAINVNAMRSVRNNMGTGNHGTATIPNPLSPAASGDGWGNLQVH